MLKKFFTIFILLLFAIPVFSAPLQMISPDYYREGDIPDDRIELCDELEFKTEEYGMNPKSGYRCARTMRNISYILESDNSQSIHLKAPEGYISLSRPNGIFFTPSIVPKDSVLKIQVENFQRNKAGFSEIIIYGKSEKWGYLYDKELIRQNISKRGTVNFDLDFYFKQGTKDILILAGDGVSAKIQGIGIDNKSAPVTTDKDNKKFIFFTIILVSVIFFIIIVLCFIILSKI